MDVFRVEKNKDFTVMSNIHLRDSSLSLKAKGLLSYMLSLPEDWDLTEFGLTKTNKESMGAISSAIKELIAAGYIHRSRERDAKGKLGKAIYQVHEKPMLENPMLDNPTLEEPTLENPQQRNTNILNTNKQNTKILNTEYISATAKRSVFVPPTIDDVRAYAIEKGIEDDAESFFYYYDSKDWKVGREKMKNWKSAYSGWVLRNKKNQRGNRQQTAKEKMDDFYKMTEEWARSHENGV